MNAVYLIDDSSGSGQSKFRQLPAFIAFLNKATGEEWCMGTMIYEGNTVPHSYLLSCDADQIVKVLDDPRALVLVDVSMNRPRCYAAADALLTRFPTLNARALEIGGLLVGSLEPIRAIPDEYRLCASVIALGEAKCARVAVVSTETQMPARGVVGLLGPPEIGWNPAGWSAQVSKLRDLINQNILKDVIRERKIWDDMRDATGKEQWWVADKSGRLCKKKCILFPTVQQCPGFENNHHLDDPHGHLMQVETLKKNAVLLEKETAFSICSTKCAKERVAILKSAYRGSQLPVFILQRMLGLPETRDLWRAVLCSKPGWDVPAVCLGLKALGANKPKLTFELPRIDGLWTLKVTMVGTDSELEGAWSALNLGATRRYRERNGSTGNLTFGLEMLSPTHPKKQRGRIEVTRAFTEGTL